MQCDLPAAVALKDLPLHVDRVAQVVAVRQAQCFDGYRVVRKGRIEPQRARDRAGLGDEKRPVLEVRSSGDLTPIPRAAHIEPSRERSRELTELWHQRTKAREGCRISDRTGE